MTRKTHRPRGMDRAAADRGGACMARVQRGRAGWLCGILVLWATAAASQPLTVERAVQIAIQKSSAMVGAEAGLLDARSSLYGAYSGVLPHVSVDWSRDGGKVSSQTGIQLFGVLTTPSAKFDQWNYSSTPRVTGTWPVLDLSALKSLGSARRGTKARELKRQSTRSDVALQTRQQFYLTAGAYHLGSVANAAVRLARENERRVRALFDVGSVSRSDVLSAQVQTANSVLDSVTAQ